MSTTKALRKKAEPEDATPVADPNVLLYLRAVSKAFPRVERDLDSIAEQKRAVVDKTQLTAAEKRRDEIVADAAKRREEYWREIHELRAKRKELEGIITEEEQAFVSAHAQRQCDGEEVVARMEARVGHMRARQAEADEWNATSARVAREISTLESKIEEMRSAHRLEVLSLHERFRGEERKLRDVLVKKLRQTRDYLTSVADDDDDDESDTLNDGSGANLGVIGGGGRSGDLGAAGSSSRSASMKLNEQLSREVSMYEREIKMVIEHNQELQAAEAANRVKLEEERAGNEKLVARNASHTKTKKVLRQKLSEMQKQNETALGQHASNHEVRVKALRETIESQNKIIDDLNGELEELLAQYEDARATQRAARTDTNDFCQRLARVAQFSVALLTDPENDIHQPIADHSLPGPPAAALLLEDRGGDTSIDGHRPSHGRSCPTVSCSGAVELIPHLGITDRAEAAKFVAALVTSVT